MIDNPPLTDLLVRLKGNGQPFEFAEVVAEIERLRAEGERLRAEVARKDAALRAAYEVYAGSEGFVAETCAEGYQQQIIKQMVDCISAAQEK